MLRALFVLQGMKCSKIFLNLRSNLQVSLKVRGLSNIYCPKCYLISVNGPKASLSYMLLEVYKKGKRDQTGSPGKKSFSRDDPIG